MAALMLGGSLLVYGGALPNGLVADDHVLVAGQRLFADWRQTPRLMTTPLPHTLGSTFVYYRPLVSLSFMVDYQFWGLWPPGFRLTNIAIHAANGVLVYWLAQSLFSSGTAAVLSALLFIAHPLGAEVVDHIYNRAEALATFFRLLALLLFFRSRQAVCGHGAHYVASLAAFTAALLSKEAAVTFPLAVLALDLWGTDRKRDRFTEYLMRHAPFWLIAIGNFTLRVTILYPLHIQSQGPGSVPSAFAQSTHVFTLYSKLICFPVRLYQEYSLALVSPTDLTCLFGAALLSGCFLSVVLTRQALRHLAVLAAWIGAGLIPLYPTFAGRVTVDADRFLYMPVAGLALVVGLTLKQMMRVGHVPRTGRASACNVRTRLGSWPLLVALALGCALTYATLASRQARFWRSEVSHWSRKFAGAPQDARIQGSLAAALFKAGRQGLAIHRLRRLVARYPDDLRARVNLGMGLIAARQWNQAVFHLDYALQADPMDAQARLALATAYGGQGETERAEAELRVLLRQQPHHVHALRLLTRLYESVQRYEDALAEYEVLLGLERDRALQAAIRQRIAALRVMTRERMPPDAR